MGNLVPHIIAYFPVGKKRLPKKEKKPIYDQKPEIFSGPYIVLEMERTKGHDINNSILKCNFGVQNKKITIKGVMAMNMKLIFFQYYSTNILF